MHRAGKNRMGGIRQLPGMTGMIRMATGMTCPATIIIIRTRINKLAGILLKRVMTMLTTEKIILPFVRQRIITLPSHRHTTNRILETHTMLLLHDTLLTLLEAGIPEV
jgi:hypothetical protein